MFLAAYTVGGANAITLTGNMQGSLTKIGAGTLTLGGTVDNVGLAITANVGTVILAKNPSTGGLIQLGGTGGVKFTSEPMSP